MAFYRAANGERIEGLSKLGDGRWRISALPGKRLTFTEPSESAAIAKYMEIINASKQLPIGIPRVYPSVKAKIFFEGKKTFFLGKPVGPIIQAPKPQNRSKYSNLINHIHNYVAQPLLMTISEPYADGAPSHERTAQSYVDENDFFALMADLLTKRPKYCADRTGIPALAWLGDIKRPADSPKLQSLIDSYTNKSRLSDNERTRAASMWTEFVQSTGALTLHDITHETVAQYEDHLATTKLAPKSVKHRICKVRTVIAYAMRRGADTAECRRALDVLAMLDTPESNTLAPHPISKKDFWIFYNAATKAHDITFATMLLVMLNCAMYPGEAAALKWNEINLETGEVVTARPKTGVCRVAILWLETIAALKMLPHDRDDVFMSARRAFTTQICWKTWDRYRTALELPTAKPSDIRDAAYTIACRSVSLDKAKILAGHRLPGATDNYVQRNPGFVKEACDAIHKAFFS